MKVRVRVKVKVKGKTQPRDLGCYANLGGYGGAACSRGGYDADS